MSFKFFSRISAKVVRLPELVACTSRHNHHVQIIICYVSVVTTILGSELTSLMA